MNDKHLVKRKLKLSIIIPAYNEEKNIITAVTRNMEVGREIAIDFEIIAINDGSTDDTGRRLAELEPSVPELVVKTHSTNRGIGAGIVTGIDCANGEFVIFAPADNPLEIDVIRPFLNIADHADLILGYRMEKPGYSCVMKFNSRVYHFLLRHIAGLPYRDINWIHLYRREIFHHLDIEFEGIVMAAEVVLKAHRRGLRIREVPCPMVERQHGRASASRLPVMIKTGLDLARLLIRSR